MSGPVERLRPLAQTLQRSRGLAQNVQVTSKTRYLAVIQGCDELVGAQRQFWPLVEVHPPAHVVQMLEIKDRNWKKR